ncbi:MULTISPECIES: putative bifunctional diguanylate cyclase/phosphodiesterase [unclassified Sedimentibacter]|uniref:putative bifunctional diguanylate cyclase/phosphodiesterase n=1 Tax=unclassified Sedimentibacter TaxID=2649220 RepID=UPI0027DEF843|nr:EAL domain-containing protein [Sedimentibacter sp. MB35-C1]WMJ77750.1 EAL domain-containing protein [Sedimentibacter sp. MB35-C1]
MLKNSHEEISILMENLEYNEFFVHYQPIVDAATYEIRWIEALARWNSPIAGTVSPDKFIPVLEEKLHIIPVGMHILKKACMQLKRWYSNGCTNSGISVNVSSLQLQQHNFAEAVVTTLHEFGLKPHNLVLEITESLKLMGNEHALQTLKVLKEMGIRISIDDFGTGYNCLKCLQEFEFTSIKIDRSFVANMGNNRCKIIIDSIISLGHRIGVKVIAEGVETIEQCNQLKHMGCDMLQGYYFYLPSPAEELSLLLKNDFINKSMVQ